MLQTFELAALIYLLIGTIVIWWNREAIFREQDYGVWEGRRGCQHPPWPVGHLPDCPRCRGAIRVTRVVGTALSIAGWPFEVMTLLWNRRHAGHRHVHLRPGTVAVSGKVPDVSEAQCFLCNAPGLSNREDGCNAYLGGFVHGVVAMMGRGRPTLCSAHETTLREVLVVFVQNADVYAKLGIEAKVLVQDDAPQPAVFREGLVVPAVSGSSCSVPTDEAMEAAGVGDAPVDLNKLARCSAPAIVTETVKFENAPDLVMSYCPEHWSGKQEAQAAADLSVENVTHAPPAAYQAPPR
jgi:hypothetical protein